MREREKKIINNTHIKNNKHLFQAINISMMLSNYSLDTSSSSSNYPSLGNTSLNHDQQNDLSASLNATMTLNESGNTSQAALDPNNSIIYSSDKYYMPGTASLIEDVDKQLMVMLRDGKMLIGYLRSIDQYANLLLSNTIERVCVGNKYGETERGIYIIRGENVVLIGEIDQNQNRESTTNTELVRVSFDEILELKKAQEEKEHEAESVKRSVLMEHRGGLLLPHGDSIMDDYY